jgi:hypothetical protein
VPSNSGSPWLKDADVNGQSDVRFTSTGLDFKVLTSAEGCIPGATLMYTIRWGDDLVPQTGPGIIARELNKIFHFGINK